MSIRINTSINKLKLKSPSTTTSDIPSSSGQTQSPSVTTKPLLAGSASMDRKMDYTPKTLATKRLPTTPNHHHDDVTAEEVFLPDPDDEPSFILKFIPSWETISYLLLALFLGLLYLANQQKLDFSISLSDIISFFSSVASFIVQSLFGLFKQIQGSAKGSFSDANVSSYIDEIVHLVHELPKHIRDLKF